MKVCTVNVRRLTKARLKDVFSPGPREDVDFIFIQEPRLEVLSPGWMIKLADDHGFVAACSEVPAKDSRGRVLFWNRCLGRVAIHRASDHRSDTRHHLRHMGQHSTQMTSGLTARSCGFLSLLEKMAQSFGMVTSIGDSSMTGLWLEIGLWQSKRWQRPVQTHSRRGVSPEVPKRCKST